MLSLNMDSLGYPFYCVIYSVRVRFRLTNFHVTCYRSDCNLGKINCSHVVYVFPFFLVYHANKCRIVTNPHHTMSNTYMNYTKTRIYCLQVCFGFCSIISALACQFKHMLPEIRIYSLIPSLVMFVLQKKMCSLFLT